MDAHCLEIIKQYKDLLPQYQRIEEVVHKELEKIADGLKMVVDCIESRVKTLNSLEGKLETKGYKYKDVFDITDIVGARVVTFYSSEVDKIAANIEKRFIIDWGNSVDKRKMVKIDQFGYMSLHFVCKLPRDIFYDEIHPELNEIRFEIQLRTVLQHAWASIYHDTGYKHDIEVPVEYLRSLTRLAGLLELADEEFNHIRSSLDDYRKRVKAIVKSGRFEEVDLNKDSLMAFIGSGGFNKINKRICDFNNMDLENVPLNNYLAAFKRFGFSTLGDIKDLTTKYEDDAYKLATRQLEGLDIDIVSSSIGPQFLCTVYALKHGYDEVDLKHLYDIMNGVHKTHERYAKRIYLLAKNCGII